jgi:two-component system, OmpR family, osmolarity sensor histidine kinase EnvZ
MPAPPKRLAWLKSGLLWRTFFLLGILITISMAASVASFRMVERMPAAQQMAAQVVSMVTITRAALTHSAPDLRRELLFDLASNEGIRVYPLETTDRVEAPPDSSLLPAMQDSVRSKLGADTKFAGKVNDVAGFWVSFKIDDDDEYWLMLERERLERFTGLQWLGWAAVVFLLSLLGAVFISRLINQPLARLASAARSIATGRQPDPLPEIGPTEIIEANRSFNQMAEDLKRVESDRAVILAGISHDLRTPLARMQLEVEMAQLSDDARAGIQSDIGQMDEIIGQFLDYAKPIDDSNFTELDLSALLNTIAQETSRLPDVRITTDIDSALSVVGNSTDLRRVVQNLVENARRYGKSTNGEQAEIEIHCHPSDGMAVIDIADHGSGVPQAETERLLRPFTRLDTARGQANGSGLGLAIVERIVKRHGGKLALSNRDVGGLNIRITLPLADTADRLAA